MAVRRMGLELVFNLQWKNKPENGGDKANVVGMYDIPTTTQNFETFKSYLLKNSGAALNDVKLIYLTDNDGEWVIENQTCFEIALCAFRLKARLGEVIFLKLDKLSDSKSIKMLKKSSSDVQTQYEEASSAIAAVTAANNNKDNDDNIPPNWFLEYMTNLKKELIDEVTASVSNVVLVTSKDAFATPVVEVPKTTTTPPPPPAPLVWKPYKKDSGKRSRKHLNVTEYSVDKELIKSLKLERKLDCKLDRLDAKIKKTLEKKRAIAKTGELSTAACTCTKQYDDEDEEEIPLVVEPDIMNASLVNEAVMKPHMLGGERYLHTWEVINVGKMRWHSNVQLRLTWGSVEMVPAVKNIPVPKLRPGEIGYISVLFQIPKKPGQYESYWNFFENDRRFGQSLSFCVVVDPPSTCFDYIFNTSTKVDETNEEAAKSCPNEFLLTTISQNEVQETSATKTETKPDLIDDCSDSDNQSISSVDENLESKKPDDEFILLSRPDQPGRYRLTEEDEQELAIDLSKHLQLKKMTEKDEVKGNLEQEQKQQQELQKNENEQKPTNEQVEAKPEHDNNNNNNSKSSTRASSESISKIDDETPSEASGYNMVTLSASDDESGEDYIFIEVKGQKVLLPKNILHPNYVAAAAADKSEDKKAEETTHLKKESTPPVQEENNATDGGQTEKCHESYASHCSTTGTCFSDLNSFGKPTGPTRHFVFPHNNPGFEIIYPEATSGQPFNGFQVPPPKFTFGLPPVNATKIYSSNGNSGFPPKTTVINNTEYGFFPRSTTFSNGETVFYSKPTTTTTVNNGAPGFFPKPPIASNGDAGFFPKPGDAGFFSNGSIPVPVKDGDTGFFRCSAPTTTTNASGPYGFFPGPPAPKIAKDGDFGFLSPLNQGIPLNNYIPDTKSTYTWAQSKTKYTTADIPDNETTTRYPAYPGYAPSHRLPTVSASSSEFTHVPNLQQTPKDQQEVPQYVPESRPTLEEPVVQTPKPSSEPTTESPRAASSSSPAAAEATTGQGAAQVHILPENLVNGAVNVASSALNTARSVINMLTPPRSSEAGNWVNGHWITNNPDSKRAKNLRILNDMGFWDTDLNATLLARYNDDLGRVVTELVQ